VNTFLSTFSSSLPVGAGIVLSKNRKISLKIQNFCKVMGAGPKKTDDVTAKNAGSKTYKSN